MSDLLVSMYTPVLRSGRAMRTYTIARALSATDGLDLLYLRFDGDEPDAKFTAIPGVRMHAVSSTRSPRRIAAYAANRIGSMPAAFARGVSPELASAAARLATAPERGRVIADGPIAAATLAGLSRHRAVIYNAHNLESAFRHELHSQRRRAAFVAHVRAQSACTRERIVDGERSRHAGRARTLPQRPPSLCAKCG